MVKANKDWMKSDTSLGHLTDPDKTPAIQLEEPVLDKRRKDLLEDCLSGIITRAELSLGLRAL